MKGWLRKAASKLGRWLLVKAGEALFEEIERKAGGPDQPAPPKKKRVAL